MSASVLISLRLALLFSSLLVAGCGSEALSPPRVDPVVEALDVDDVPRDALTLPNESRSIKFAIIGDSGRGSAEQHAVAAQMVAYRQRFDYRLKFEEPYKLLLDAGVKFFAVLGNHDDPQQIHYGKFNMDGHRYYTFTPPLDLVTRLDTRVRFFAIDSTKLDGEQMAWLEKELHESTAEWKIALLHYPLYTAGRYALAARGHRFALESAFVDGGVDVAFSGHEHFYQRSQLQRGILYFVTGGAGSLRAGDAKLSAQIARSYDADYSFMLAEVTDDGFFFQAIDRQGKTIDAGSLKRAATADTTAPR